MAPETAARHSPPAWMVSRARRSVLSAMIGYCLPFLFGARASHGCDPRDRVRLPFAPECMRDPRPKVRRLTEHEGEWEKWLAFRGAAGPPPVPPRSFD
ncbi:hypothetical protein GCM10010294_52720 [Streptomyces griseoloalbus]|nr:hypothetical protein GCM10010294_52720 [Streptomyces griseoloalbus]